MQPRPPIRLYWFRPDDGSTNYGDALSPLLVERLTGRRVVWAPGPGADLLGIGSILAGVYRRRWQRPFLGRLSPIEVWGSGVIRPGRPLRSRMFRFRAVRGAETRARVGAGEATPLGDPGLIVPMLYEGLAGGAKFHSWGIVPHVNDRASPAVAAMHAATPRSVVADLAGGVEAVTRTIAGCDFVISTSLHGLVVADAFGIPTIWASVSDNVAGGEYKFLDYYSAFGAAAPSRLVLAGGRDLRMLESSATRRDPARVSALGDGLVRALADF